jgi:hypothetical protein
MTPLAVLQVNEKKTGHSPEAAWSDSDSLCCLADSERSLGYILDAGDCWLAYDTTHLNDLGTDFQFLGVCRDAAAAKRSVEWAVNCSPGTHNDRFEAAPLVFCSKDAN